MRLFVHLCVLMLLAFPHAGQTKDWVYVMSEGDNLWNISKKHLNKVSYYEDVRRINNITRPRQIPPGTLIRIPLEWVKRHAASVTVKYTKGDHQLVRNGKLQPLTLKDKLILGDELRLDGNGSVTLKFADGSEMTLSDNVIISFDHLTQFGTTGMVDSRVRINQGKMEIRAEKQQGAGSRLDIASASAVTSVRGTVFRVGVDSSNPSTSLVEVVEGEVAVSQGGNSIAVPQGYGLKLETGKPISSPVKLLTAPKITNFLSTIATPQYELQWTSIESSQSYNMSLATDVHFSSIIWQQNTKSNSFSLPKLGDGNYHIRITALDSNGIEGNPADYQFQLNQFPLAPTLNPTKVIYKNNMQPLTWQSSHDNSDVILQISQSKAFGTLAFSSVVTGNSYLLNTQMPMGKYYWRLATVEDAMTNSYGPFSEPIEFLLTVNLPSPLLQGKIKYGQIIVTPINTLAEQQIELELAPTFEFDNKDTYTIGGKDDFMLPKSDKKVQYLRAKIKDPKHNLFSAWSRHCKVSEQQYVVCGV